VQPNQRDARQAPSGDKDGFSKPARDSGIEAAKKFQKFVEYDFSKMTDTKGGFLTAEDDPHNRALHTPNQEQKPANMTLREWEKAQLIKKLKNEKAGPYEPGLSALGAAKEQKKCRECGTLEIDWKWDDVFGCQVCKACQEKFPDKYSLLTKTEAREDYLLTDPELKDEQLLPRMEKANPHKSTWNNMMLYLRYQVEEYAFSDKKWGSAEALDEEFVKRQAEAKRRKEAKFKSKLNDLKRRTRVDAYKRQKAGVEGGKFGDKLWGSKHEHEWGRAVEKPESGATIKTCVECGMEVEELEF
jgi:DNA-repair protein complementing XP-A cells